MTGRPLDYPTYMYVAFGRLIGLWDSARGVEAELSDPMVWEMLCDEVRAVFPHDPSKWLPRHPMRRHHFLHFKKTRTTLEDLDDMQAEFTVQSARLARDSGLMNPEGEGSLTYPHRDRMIYGDGKVITPLTNALPGDFRIDADTGEKIYLRADPDATEHREGGSSADVRGLKFATIATRTEEDRIILGVGYVKPGKGGEVAEIMRLLDRSLPHLPGAQVVGYDMALRGVHANELITKYGVLPITKVPRKSSKGKESKGPREEKLEVRSIKTAPGRSELVTFWVRNGSPGVYIPDVEGVLQFVPLKRKRIIRNSNKSGGFRIYQQYQLPRELGGDDIIFRQWTDEEDLLSKLNRTEVLRSIPPDDPHFAYLYGRRADIESINRSIEDSLYLKRAHSIGWKAQLFDMICWALGVNAEAEARIRSRGHTEAA